MLLHHQCHPSTPNISSTLDFDSSTAAFSQHSESWLYPSGLPFTLTQSLCNQKQTLTVKLCLFLLLAIKLWSTLLWYFSGTRTCSTYIVVPTVMIYLGALWYPVTLPRIFSVLLLQMIIWPSDYMVSFDLQDTYLHVPIHREHRRYFWYIFQGLHFQWRVLPFGTMSFYSDYQTHHKVLAWGIVFWPYRGRIWAPTHFPQQTSDSGTSKDCCYWHSYVSFWSHPTGQLAVGSPLW